MHTVYTLALISDAFTDTVLPFERKKYGKLMHLDVYIIVHNITYDLKSPEKRRREFFFFIYMLTMASKTYNVCNTIDTQFQNDDVRCTQCVFTYDTCFIIFYV